MFNAAFTEVLLACLAALLLVAAVIDVRTFTISKRLNLTLAACVLAYWVTRWYSYLFQGITWEASDQLFPLYAALVCALAIVSLSGRHHLVTLNWIVFAIHGVVTIGAVLFVTFFKMRMF